MDWQRTLGMTLITGVVMTTVACAGAESEPAPEDVGAQASGLLGTTSESSATPLVPSNRTPSSVTGATANSARSTGGTAVASAPPSRPAPPQEVWSRADLDIVSQPVAVGDLVVAYALVDGLYEVVAIDPADGHTVWQAHASTSVQLPSKALRPVVVGSDVVYLEPADLTENYLIAAVVVADGATGEITARSEAAYWVAELPVSCRAEICWRALEAYDCAAGSCDPQWRDDTVHVVSLDPSLGTTAAVASLAIPSHATIGPDGLTRIGRGDVNSVGRVVGGELLWEVPSHRLFGDGYTATGNAEYIQRPSTFVHQSTVGAYIGTASKGFDHGPQHLRERVKLMSIDDATGQRQWVREGLSSLCIPEVLGDPAVACEFSAGTEVVTEEGTLAYRHASVSLVGYDRATGETTWTVPLASPDGLALPEWFETIHPASGNSVLIDTATGRAAVNLVTGDVEPATTGHGWCTAETTVAVAITLWIDRNGTKVDRVGDSTITPCDADGNPVSPVGLLPAWAGARVGPHQVVRTAAGLVGYQQDSP